MAMGCGSGRVVPPLTVKMARASNPRGTAAMWMRDRLDELFVDEDFAAWYPADGRPGLSPARLALVSVLQYTENLTDRQAAEAVRCRLDWKYCLGLELDDAGFDFSVLSEFRDRLAEGDRADRLLAVMVERLAAAGLVKRRGRIRTDSTHVLAAVRRLNRGELVAETLRVALEELVAHGEEWLATLVTADWADRYGRPVRYDRLPRGGDALIAYVLRVGEDGMHILRAVHDADAPPELRVLPAVEVLRQVWVQQYWIDEDGRLRWRGPKSSRDRASRRTTERRNTGKASADGRPDPASARVPWSGMEIVTPHDPEARYSQKITAAGQRDWIGYRDHQSETCDETSPNVIVQVTTRPAPEQDIDALDRIHQGLTGQGFQPAEHVVDSGYISPDSIHHAAQHWDIPLFGPVRDDPQAGKRPGFAKQDFHIDWQARTLTCPNGVTSPPWKPTLGDGHPRLSVLFPRKACRECADRLKCTGNAEGKGRHVFLMPQPLQEIQTKARADQTTAEWRRRYAIRAGCEATVSETVHAHGLRTCRYRGMARTHVQHVLTAAGTNIIRLSEYLSPGITPPRSPRPRSRFQTLCRSLPT
ncbi:IS1182 family transposase [Streptomyces sp. NBC_01361]|uniref:IS1182 family transposase n=1 Tax=Streptomyces sp. NBC_01361 TaxID=2903838 RepID=UPI002E306440|nr:IS1182 family transposase [Streptomyces sp. NBC_01361]